MASAWVRSIIGTCAVQVDVTSTTPGNQINTIQGGIHSDTGNNGAVTISSYDPASATIAPGVTVLLIQAYRNQWDG